MVPTEVNVTKATTSNLAANAVLVANTKILLFQSVSIVNCFARSILIDSTAWIYEVLLPLSSCFLMYRGEGFPLIDPDELRNVVCEVEES